MNNKEWNDIAEYLYTLLDDIDTISDIAKDNDKLYRKLVEKVQQKKSLVADTDGYTLIFKPINQELLNNASILK